MQDRVVFKSSMGPYGSVHVFPLVCHEHALAKVTAPPLLYILVSVVRHLCRFQKTLKLEEYCDHSQLHVYVTPWGAAEASLVGVHIPTRILDAHMCKRQQCLSSNSYDERTGSLVWRIDTPLKELCSIDMSEHCAVVCEPDVVHAISFGEQHEVLHVKYSTAALRLMPLLCTPARSHDRPHQHPIFPRQWAIIVAMGHS